jgi:hypothetical protein
MKDINLKKDIIVVSALAVLTALFSLASFSTINVKPNVFIVIPIVAALLIESWYVFLGFILLEMLWLKFTPFLMAEYGVIFILGLISFIISKLLIFGKILVVRTCLVLFIQLAFWIALQSSGQILSLIFLLEFIYNVIIEELLFAFGTWLKKKFS